MKYLAADLALVLAVIALIAWRLATETPPQAQLRTVALEFTEQPGKLGIEWTLANNGNADVTANGIGVAVVYRNFIFDDDLTPRPPTNLAGGLVPLNLDGGGLRIPAGGQATVRGEWRWDAAVAAPTLAVLRAKLLLMHDEETLCESAVHNIVLENKPGAMEHVFAGATLSREFAGEAAAFMEQCAGPRLPLFEETCKRMQAAAK